MHILLSYLDHAKSLFFYSLHVVKSGRSASPTTDTKSEKSILTATTGMSVSGPTAAVLSARQTSSTKEGRSPEAFVSLQLEKGPSRDLMLNDFVNKKAQMGTILKNPVEMEKLKRFELFHCSCNFNWHVKDQHFMVVTTSIIALKSTNVILMKPMSS